MAIILTLRLMMLTVKLAAIQFSEDEGEHSVTSHIHFAAVQEVSKDINLRCLK